MTSDNQRCIEGDAENGGSSSNTAACTIKYSVIKNSQVPQLCRASEERFWHGGDVVVREGAEQGQAVRLGKSVRKQFAAGFAPSKAWLHVLLNSTFITELELVVQLKCKVTPDASNAAKACPSCSRAGKFKTFGK